LPLDYVMKTMTNGEKLDVVLYELRTLRAMVEQLAQREESRSGPESSRADDSVKCKGCIVEPARADDLVCAHYFARMTGLSPVTITQGKAGTGEVRLYSKRPRRWLKGDVDRFARERAASLRSPKQKALKYLERRGGR
jgi:hypothetical protein